MNKQINSSPLSFKKLPIRRGAVFGLILLGALLAFEVFNYSTTDFALTDLLGANLTFAGVRWATILSLAFCGIDFAGIARLFTPEKGREQPSEVWYLFAAWLMAAMMNATLTWWGVSVAIRNHQTLASGLLPAETLFTSVPVFVAVMVGLIRVMIIGTFSMAGGRLFSFDESQPAMINAAMRSTRVNRNPVPAGRPASASVFNPQPKPAMQGFRPTPLSARPAVPNGRSSAHPVYSGGNSAVQRSLK
jgi:hypothetical protein